ncbi:MAG: 50S ribosomal protein L31e [Nanoarchaeota archaeon]
MAEKNSKEEKIEREYTIPLFKEWIKAARYKKANKAVRALKEFIVRHMKIRDKDLNKVKLDRYLNEYIWDRGIRHPPHKVKVKAIKEGDIVRVELVEYPERLKFKKQREEKFEEKSKAGKEKKKKEKSAEEKTSEEIEREKEEKEKKTSVVEEGLKLEKEAAKRVKQEAGFEKQKKQPKHQFRQALEK